MGEILGEEKKVAYINGGEKIRKEDNFNINGREKIRKEDDLIVDN